MKGGVSRRARGAEQATAPADEAIGSGCEVLRIGERDLGCDFPVYTIAELGSNHDGRLDRALDLIAAAAEAGADAVKFQSFSAAALSRRSEPSFSLLEQLALPTDWHEKLRDAAAMRDLHFLSTPFDEQRAELLFELGVPAFKIASGDLTHHPLLRQVAAYGRPLLISTGLAHLAEVRAALDAIRAFQTPHALLHCCAAYPPHFEELNLRAVQTLAREFRTVVGLSDHSPGHSAVLAAIPLGARIIEKHVTFDRTLEGPDHAYALTVDEFAAMVEDIRRVEAALGDGRKRPVASEAAGRTAGRRSVHAALEIRAGTAIESHMIKIVRPAEGIAPEQAPELLGRRVQRTLLSDQPIQWSDLA